MTAPRLAVLTPSVGQPSETFVRRHVNDLQPGALVVTTGAGASPPAWVPSGREVRLAGGGGGSLAWLAERVRAKVERRPSGRWTWEPGRTDLDVLDAAFRQEEIGVVLTEYLDVWLPLLPWLARQGVRVVAHAHGYDISTRLQHPWWRARYRDYAAADAVVTVSEVARQRLVETGLDPARIAVIPCGVDVDAEPPTRAERDTVEVVAVGRLVPKKDPLTTFAAFASVAADDPRLRLVMVGDGPLRPALAEAVDAAGLADRVTLAGALDHAGVLAALRHADVFAQHSVVDADGDEEGLPVALLEAMAAGLPVVSTWHGGIPEAVEHGVSGFLVDEHDTEAMSAALATLADDAELRRTIGGAAHAAAADRFSWASERTALSSLLGLDAA